MQGLAFDPLSGYIYAQDSKHALILVSPGGVRKKEYQFTERLDIDQCRGVRQYLVHPDGNKFLAQGNAPGIIYYLHFP